MTSHSSLTNWTGQPFNENAPLASPVKVNVIHVPEKPARVTKSTGSTYEVYGIHGISRDDANNLIVALDRVPSLRYIAIDLMRLVHPLLSEEEYGDE